MLALADIVGTCSFVAEQHIGVAGSGGARRRDVSLHSRSVIRVRSMDIFTTLVQTAKKLGVSAYAYLRDRISRRFELPSLAQSILAAIEAQTTEAA